MQQNWVRLLQSQNFHRPDVNSGVRLTPAIRSLPMALDEYGFYPEQRTHIAAHVSGTCALGPTEDDL